MSSLAASALQGWRRAALACLLGALATGAMPPISLWPLLFPAFTGLLVLLGSARGPKAAFIDGWCFALGFFTTGLYWIANALLIDAAAFWWMVPFAVVGLPAFLALFVGVATAAWRWLAPGPILGAPLLAALWSLSELARGHLLTGFPWNLIGYAWWERPEPLQGMALIGAYGLGFVSVLAAAAPATLPGLIPRRMVVGALCVLPLIGLAAWGHVRLSQAPSAMVPDVRLRLVQPNIPQTVKMNLSDRIASFERLLELSARPAVAPPTALLWPETATPFLLEQEPNARAAIASLLAPGASALIGAPRVVIGPDGAPLYYNGLVALDSDDLVRGVYDKFHLVPFGEYVPLRGLLPIETVANRNTDYAFGVGPRSLRVPGAPTVGPLICYEAIFPGAVLDPADPPDWLLNVTNDAWYGASSGPYQHFVIVAARAIEEGLPMVRVANSGISGVIDPYGRVIARLGLDQMGVLDVGLPEKLTSPPLYARIGNLPLLFVVLLISFWAAVNRSRQKYRISLEK
jgi:apolipoprotein N-acyltransferase